VLRGRAFNDQDGPDAPPAVLISETFARRVWGNEDPLGKRLQMGGFGPTGGPWRTVVGIVGDVRHRGLDAARSMQVYLPQTQWLDSSTVLVVRTSGDPAALAGAVRNAIWSVDKDQPISNVATMVQVIGASMAERRFAMTLFSIFAGLALVLAAVGLYGVLAHSVSTRTNEIGVRIALGAQKASIYRLVLSQGLYLTALGIGIGVAGAAGLTRFLESQLFGVTATDPVTFAAVPALLAAVALLACYVPARRATRVDPMVALRYE
jgi:putative ABC transport system permease protein